MTVGEFIDGLKHYDLETEIIIYDSGNSRQYDIDCVCEDEANEVENPQVMIIVSWGDENYE